MRICHMTSVHNQNDPRIFYKECVSLAKAGYDTYLVARGESCERDGVHIIGVGQPTGGRLSRMTKFSKLVYQSALKINADIYHLHDPELLPYGLKLKKKGKKVIFDSHEDTLNQMSEKEWIPKILRLPISFAYPKYARKVFYALDAIVSVTPHLQKTLKEINNNTWMITNYPRLRKNKKTICKNDFSLCFTGGLTEDWSHKEILLALEGIRDISYTLCGSGGAYLESLKSLPAWENVDFKGKLPFEQMFDIQSSATVGMAILRYSNNSGGKIGTLGNTKLFEYMMAGLPVICTNFILWKDIIERYHCGIYVDPYDVNAISEAILYIKAHPEEAKEMGKNGRRAVEEEFNWETQEKVLLKLYRDLEVKINT